MEEQIRIAVYGKGGIGKSTMSVHLSAALALCGKKVLQIGCDPKHDSTRLLMQGEETETVLDYLRTHGKEDPDLSAVLKEGAFGIGCVEAGGPMPGVGCAGRGILSAFEFLEQFQVPKRYDAIVYDVLGDVVCGGFAVPVRREYANRIFLVTSGEYMAIYAANNILRGIRSFDRDHTDRVAGIILNQRNLPDEIERVERFAEAAGLPIVVSIPRSEAFAQAEKQNRTIQELEGFDREKELFRSLAERIERGMPLYPANPLTDAELEAVVLGKQKLHPPVAVKSIEQKIPEQERRNTLPDQKEDRRLPLYGCAFTGASTQAVHLTDAKIIAHAPAACAFYTWQNISSPGRKNLFSRGILMPSAISPNYSCTELTQTDAVFGGMEKLREHVRRAAASGAGAVVVISACVSGIICDDIQALENLSTKETPVLCLKTDGVIAGDYMEGIRLCMHTLGNKLIDKSVKPEGKRVNLIGEIGVSNNNEVNDRIVRDLLSEMGIQIHCRFLGDARTQEVRTLLKAPLNLMASDSAQVQELRDWLEKDYGCRFAGSPLPVGFKETRKWLYELADYFDLRPAADHILEKEADKYQAEVQELRPLLSGKRILVTTINASLDWLLETADDLGMEIVWIGVLNYLRTPLTVSAHPAFREKMTEEVDYRLVQEKILELEPDIVVSNYTQILPDGDKTYIDSRIFMTQVVGFGSGLVLMRGWAEQIRKKQLQNTNQKRKGSWKDDRSLYEEFFG